MPDLPATSVATPANTAPVAPKPAAQTATPSAATGATSGTAAPEVFWEGTVDGKPVKYTKAQADRLMSKAGFADKLISQTKEQAREWTKRLSEFEEKEKAAKERAKADTDAWLKEHGIDPDEYVRGKVTKKVQEHEMTPEQREAAAAKAEAEALKKQLADRDEKEKQARVSANAKRLAKQMEDTLHESVTRAGLKPSPDMLIALNDVMTEWAKYGMLDPSQPFSPSVADTITDAAHQKIQEAKQDLTQRVAKGLEGQALEDFLGSDVIDRAIAHRIALKRNGGKLPTAPTQQPPVQRKPDEGPAYKSIQQLREEREARMRR